MKAYRDAEKRLQKLDGELQAALDKLASARTAGNREACMKARQVCADLEKRVEEAESAAQELHRRAWAEIQSKHRAEIREALGPAVRYRWAGYCRGEGGQALDGVVHAIIQELGAVTTVPPDEFLKEAGLPVAPWVPESLDRAESEI